MDLEYHISGALKRTRTQKVDNGTVLYDEILYYEDCVDRSDCIPQYGGNIARMAQWLNHSNPLKGKQRDAAYTYDELNRLTNVNEQLQNDFDEEISYDVQGRIRSMQRGIAVLGNGGQYTYKGNQLQNISAGMDAGNERNRQGSSTNSNYQYDSDGNRIADHSQNHVTTYNADGMAEREELLQDGNEWRVEHRYSVGSQRTAKMVFRKVDGSWQYQNGTFYTGLGMEVRENATGEGRVITQLPNGLGRYAQGSASDVEWNIKNHLGSTMLVWGQGSAKSAYDYWSFGKRMALTLASEKVTEEFTGKELDEETGLNYFGARYYDSDIGGWVSVDPMRQFASPYLYAGNGANPLNGVDTDGKKWFYLKTQTTTSQTIINLLSRISRIEGEVSEGINRTFTIGSWATDESKLYSQRTLIHVWRTEQGEKQIWPEGTKRYLTQTFIDRKAAIQEFFNRFPRERNRDQLWSTSDYMWSPIMPEAHTVDEFYTSGNNVKYEYYEPHGNITCDYVIIDGVKFDE